MHHYRPFSWVAYRNVGGGEKLLMRHANLKPLHIVKAHFLNWSLEIEHVKYLTSQNSWELHFFLQWHPIIFGGNSNIFIQMLSIKISKAIKDIFPQLECKKKTLMLELTQPISPVVVYWAAKLWIVVKFQVWLNLYGFPMGLVNIVRDCILHWGSVRLKRTT